MDEFLPLDLTEMTEKEWNEVELKARKFVQRKAFNGDAMRCITLAFCIWCYENQRIPIIDDYDLTDFVQH